MRASIWNVRDFGGLSGKILENSYAQSAFDFQGSVAPSALCVSRLCSGLITHKLFNV